MQIFVSPLSVKPLQSYGIQQLSVSTVKMWVKIQPILFSAEDKTVEILFYMLGFSCTADTKTSESDFSLVLC